MECLYKSYLQITKDTGQLNTIGHLNIVKQQTMTKEQIENLGLLPGKKVKLLGTKSVGESWKNCSAISGEICTILNIVRYKEGHVLNIKSNYFLPCDVALADESIINNQIPLDILTINQ